MNVAASGLQVDLTADAVARKPDASARDVLNHAIMVGMETAVRERALVMLSLEGDHRSVPIAGFNGEGCRDYLIA